MARPGTSLLETVAAAGNGAAVLDATQFADGGPCLDAFHDGGPCRSVLPDSRWPALSATAREHGICAILSVPGAAGQQPQMTLNVYAGTGELWRAPSLRSARLLADQAASVLAYESELTDARKEVTDIKVALETRTTIAQAQGILMARQSIGPQAAFDVLRRASQRTNTKLRDLAAEIVARSTVCVEGDTGRRPS